MPVLMLQTHEHLKILILVNKCTVVFKASLTTNMSQVVLGMYYLRAYIRTLLMQVIKPPKNPHYCKKCVTVYGYMPFG